MAALLTNAIPFAPILAVVSVLFLGFAIQHRADVRQSSGRAR